MGHEETWWKAVSTDQNMVLYLYKQRVKYCIISVKKTLLQRTLATLITHIHAAPKLLCATGAFWREIAGAKLGCFLVLFVFLCGKNERLTLSLFTGR